MFVANQDVDVIIYLQINIWFIVVKSLFHRNYENMRNSPNQIEHLCSIT